MITEMDQQLLDEFLDGQLAPAEAQRLARRLTLETALAEEMSALRAEREIRQSVFAAIAPEPAQAEIFARSLIGASRRQALRTRFGGTMRIGGGIAACIALGFMAGWIGRGRSPAPSPIAATPMTANHSAGNAPTETVADNSPAGRTSPSGRLTGPYTVWMTDGSGHMIPVQKFDRLEDAAVAADALEHPTQTNTDTEPVVYAGQF